MANATFPVATKTYHYEIDGKLYRKVTYTEAQAKAGAVQAAYNDGKSLGWFVPLIEEKKPEQQTEPEKKPNKPAA